MNQYTGVIGGVICAAAAGPVAGVSIGVFGATVGVAKKFDKITNEIQKAAKELASATMSAGQATAKKISECVNLVQCAACTGLFGALAWANRWHVNQMNCEGPSPSSECAPYKYLTGGLVMTSVGLGVLTIKKMVQWQKASQKEADAIATQEQCDAAFQAAKNQPWF